MASDISWGISPRGQTVVQRPQRRQWVIWISAVSTGSSDSSVRPLFIFWIGTSSEAMAMPIIGPPASAFLRVTPSLRPPEYSRSSAKLAPSGTM